MFIIQSLLIRPQVFLLDQYVVTENMRSLQTLALSQHEFITVPVTILLHAALTNILSHSVRLVNLRNIYQIYHFGTIFTMYFVFVCMFICYLDLDMFQKQTH